MTIFHLTLSLFVALENMQPFYLVVFSMEKFISSSSCARLLWELLISCDEHIVLEVRVQITVQFRRRTLLATFSNLAIK